VADGDCIRGGIPGSIYTQHVLLIDDPCSSHPMDGCIFRIFRICMYVCSILAGLILQRRLRESIVSRIAHNNNIDDTAIKGEVSFGESVLTIGFFRVTNRCVLHV
jgi:hypothetical protein